MSKKTIMLMGIPRSGSTLSCSILNNYKNSVALLEPMNVHDIKSRDPIEACRYINDFVFQSRKDILYKNIAQTKHSNGMIPTNTVETPSSKHLRSINVTDGLIKMKKECNENFTLVVKHNAFFVSIVKDLKNFYDCYAIIRNPLAVLCSWNGVDLPVNKGYIPAGQRFDLELDYILNKIPDRLERQMIILNWFFKNIYYYINKDNVLRYENIIANPDKTFQSLSFDGNLVSPMDKLYNNNTAKHYKGVDIKALYDILMLQEGFMWKFYTKDDVRSLYKQLMETNK